MRPGRSHRNRRRHRPPLRARADAVLRGQRRRRLARDLAKHPEHTSLSLKATTTSSSFFWRAGTKELFRKFVERFKEVRRSHRSRPLDAPLTPRTPAYVSPPSFSLSLSLSLSRRESQMCFSRLGGKISRTTPGIISRPSQTAATADVRDVARRVAVGVLGRALGAVRQIGLLGQARARLPHHRRHPAASNVSFENSKSSA